MRKQFVVVGNPEDVLTPLDNCQLRLIFRFYRALTSYVGKRGIAFLLNYELL